jgi:hypothetical protein
MGSKTPSTAAASQLAHLSTKTFFESDKARKLFFQQLAEGLQTGGVGARIPIIQRATEAQMAADAQANRQNRETTARAGLSGSPFDVANQLGARTAQSSKEAAIGPNIVQQMIGGASEATTAATGIPGLSSAANIKQQAASQGASMQGQEISAGASAGGSILAAVLASALSSA